MTENYRQHLDDRKRKTLIMNGAVLNSALSHSLLRIVFLDTPDGVAAFGDALAAGWPALLDMGDLVTVSMIAKANEALSWMDESALHPTLLAGIKAGALDYLQRVVFVRF